MAQLLTGFEGQTIEDQKSKHIKTIEDLGKKTGLPSPTLNLPFVFETTTDPDHRYP